MSEVKPVAEIIPPDTLPVAVWSGTISICGVTLHCHVLDSGERIIDANDFHTFLTALADGEIVLQEADVAAYGAFMHGGAQP